ncbi:MAG: YhgE/Pip domain-containing protein [Streptosporangiaceae bacterium]
MRALRLGIYELLRFRTPLQLAGLGFLTLVPLLYGAIYLWSNWDPYGKLNRIPVAVVNQDVPVRAEGRTVDAGGDFVAELKKERLLGWHFTDAPDAADGLKEGRYYLTITVPPDFSKKITSGVTGTPERAAMRIRLDDANNFLIGIMAETVQSELQQKIDSAAVKAYFQAAFGRLGELREGLADAANGAGELSDGLGQAKDGSGQLVGGLVQAQQGTGALAQGLGAEKQGTAALAGGLRTARQGTATLAGGLSQAKDGSGELLTALGAARQGANALADGLGQAKTGSAALVTGLGAAGQGTGALVDGLVQAKDGSGRLVTGLTRAEDGTAALTTGLGTLLQGTGELADGAAVLSRNLDVLAGRTVPVIERAAADLPALADVAVTVTGDAAELTSLAATVSGQAAQAATIVDGWLNGVAARNPQIVTSVPYQRLRQAVAALDGTVALRLQDLAAAYPQVAGEAGYREVAAAARRLDATLVSRLNRLAGRFPELRTDPGFRDLLDLAAAIAARTRRIAALAARVDDTAQAFAAAARGFSAGVPEIRRKLDAVASGVTELDAGGVRLASAARRVAQGTATAFNGATALRNGSRLLLTGARQLDTGNSRLLSGARQLSSGSSRLLSGAQQLDVGNTELLNGARELSSGSGRLLAGAQRLDSGTARLLTGARQLNSGSTRLLNGAQRLDSGTARLLTGARQLNSGSAQLLAGARSLDRGNTELLKGAQKLTAGLNSGRDKIPDITDPEATATTLASPVNVTTSNAHPAAYYGRGLAPFFIAIALWVFGLVAFLMLRPVSGRLLASRAGAPTVAFAAWLPVLGIGTLAAAILFTVLDVGLGLDPVSTAGTLAVMGIGMAAFSSIVHLLRLCLGAVGDAAALVLLMIQLVSCGGLYPVETLPEPFRTIHGFVPMTYLVSALRVTISGGQRSHVLADAGILAGYLAVALSLLVLAVHLQRRWTMGRLRPSLEL